VLIPDNLSEDGQSCDLSGKTNAYSPKLSGSIGLQYYHPLTQNYEMKFNVDLVGKSSYFTNFDLNPFTKQASYVKLDARFALINLQQDWHVALLIKNITDEHTINFSTDAPLLGAGIYSVYTEAGRTIDLQIKYEF
jgi:iron complex outermembrane receptor protein